MTPTRSFALVRQATRHHYNLLDEIGRGEFSRVFFATQNHSNTVCAVKLYEIKNIVSKSLSRAVYTEVLILESLKHPNLLSILDAHEDGNYVYIMTPICSRGTLNDCLRRVSKVDEVSVLKTIKCLANLLHFLHKNGIAHLDIRPESVLYNARGVMKLCNFGQAYIFGSECNKLSNCRQRYKPYVAPEVLSKNNFGPPAADMWSLGAVMYYMLTKRHLLSSGTCNFKFPSQGMQQEDVSLNLLDKHIIKISRPCLEILCSMLQVIPDMRKTAKATAFLCDKALQCIQRDKQSRSGKAKTETVAVNDGLSDIVHVSRNIFQYKQSQWILLLVRTETKQNI